MADQITRWNSIDILPKSVQAIGGAKQFKFVIWSHTKEQYHFDLTWFIFPWLSTKSDIEYI